MRKKCVCTYVYAYACINVYVCMYVFRQTQNFVNSKPVMEN